MFWKGAYNLQIIRSARKIYMLFKNIDQCWP